MIFFYFLRGEQWMIREKLIFFACILARVPQASDILAERSVRVKTAMWYNNIGKLARPIMYNFFILFTYWEPQLINLPVQDDSEPEFVISLRSPGIDSQPGGPLRQPYLTNRPARLLAESIPGLLKRLQIRIQCSSSYSHRFFSLKAIFGAD